MLGRRDLVAAALALGAGRLCAASVAGFTHGVASGEPTMDSVLLWTRYRPAHPRGGPVPLQVELAADAGFHRVIARGTALADADTDWTARTTLRGLPPGERAFYRFTAPDGTRSETGRTATLPADAAQPFTLALFCCANLPFGWFNAYGHAAKDAGLDLVVHLGDYIYEYPRGTYPGPAQAIAGRSIEPAGETIHLADYRARYASYRRDPDLRALHAAKPWLAVWDDHEFADDAWRDGAVNHDSATEGDWTVRKAAAARAWQEWMPVSGEDRWTCRDAGTLASLITLETRVTGRDREANFYPLAQPLARRAARLARFRDTEWTRSDRRMIGVEQERWLLGTLAAAAQRTRFQILIQSVPMGLCRMPRAACGWMPAGGAAARDEVALLVEAASAGLPFNMDNWNGYPAQRDRILDMAIAARARLVVLSGDSHNGWFYRLRTARSEAAVELSIPSVTSPGFDAWFPDADPAHIADALVQANDELAWADTARRGYGRVVLMPDAARLEWWATDPVARRSPRATRMHVAAVGAG